MTDREEHQGAGRPDLVAAIDIGSNAIRLVIAEVGPEGDLRVLERLQQATRLGKDAFTTGGIERETMQAAINVLRGYQQVLEAYHVGTVRTVATHAVREAQNRDTFIDRVFMATGLEVEIIDGAEVNRLTYTAVRHALGDRFGFGQADSLIVETSSGGTEMALFRQGEAVFSESASLGSVRMQSSEAGVSAAPGGHEARAELLRRQITSAARTIAQTHPIRTVKTVVLVGGDARLAARQVGVQVDEQGMRNAEGGMRNEDESERTPPCVVHTITRGALRRFADQVAEMAPEHAARRYAVAYEDAETLGPALLVYAALVESTAARRVIVPDVSIRDGMLLELAAVLRGTGGATYGREVVASAVNLGRRYRFDEAHSRHVADLAESLFDQLQGEHHLSAQAWLILRLAATLHDVGAFISQSSHHKHSEYIILASELFGINRETQRLVAEVARYHRRAAPKPTHANYTSLPRRSRILVCKLAAILRVADALDRTHAGRVTGVRVERAGGEMVLHVSGSDDLALERLALRTKGDLFEDVFAVRLTLQPAWETAS
jgi:exopolyphosphatase/guanosine-5'-triphosphate,3'-diphosphate pyrophosphatase